MNVMIGGSSGFIGTSLLNSLMQHNYYSLRHSGIFSVEKNTFYLDLSDKKHTDKLVELLKYKNIDIFLHLAAVTPYRFSKPPLDWNQDMKMAKNVKIICDELDVRKLVFISGWIVYDKKAKIPIKESSLLNPNTEYGKSKLNIENYFKKNIRNTELTILRLSSVYGPGQIANGLIPNLVNSAIRNKKMVIESVKTKRDYIYISDVIHILEKLFDEKERRYSVLNVGGGKSYSVYEIALTIQRIFNESFNTYVPVVADSLIHESDIKDNLLDIERLRELVPAGSFTSLHDGLMRYTQWIKRN